MLMQIIIKIENIETKTTNIKKTKNIENDNEKK